MRTSKAVDIVSGCPNHVRQKICARPVPADQAHRTVEEAYLGTRKSDPFPFLRLRATPLPATQARSITHVVVVR